MRKAIPREDYRSLAEFRHQIRRYLRFSDAAARDRDLEPGQYQLLLALKGLPHHARPRIRELAEQLQIQHHSAVELVNRLESRGLIRRQRSADDRREVLLRPTPAGEKVLRELALHHRSELRSRAPTLSEVLRRVLREGNKRQPSAKTRT
jgi:DNA-binding MarR family transcriptional regulator